MPTVKEAIEKGRRLAKDLYALGPSLSVGRELYPVYALGARDVHEIISGKGLMSLRFRMIADDVTLAEAIRMVRDSFEGTSVEAITTLERLDDRVICVREIRVRWRLK